MDTAGLARPFRRVHGWHLHESSKGVEVLCSSFLSRIFRFALLNLIELS
jgi:hypothetical protein